MIWRTPEPLCGSNLGKLCITTTFILVTITLLIASKEFHSKGDSVYAQDSDAWMHNPHHHK
jgi:hypothetical protein